jgi:SAM-dependent methyltransferase
MCENNGSHIMQPPPISQAEIDARIAPHADELLALWWAEQGASKPNDLDLIARAIPFPRARAIRVLDLCCGPGDVGRAIHAVFQNAYVDCIDRDPFLTAICRAVNAREGMPGTIVVKDLGDDDWLDALHGDAPRVTEVSDTRVQSRNPSGRVRTPTNHSRTSAANGPEYDVIATVNALHWFDAARAAQLVADVYGILRGGGVFLLAEPTSAEPPFASGFEEWKSRHPARYSQDKWWRFWSRGNAILGYDHIALLGSRDDMRIGESLTVTGWIGLLERGGFELVDVLLRDADQVVLAAAKAIDAAPSRVAPPPSQ